MKGDNISARLVSYGVLVVDMVSRLSPKPGARHIGIQLARCATAGGSNYEEARGAESRADFIHKLAIAAKEVKESLYWLKLARESSLVGPEAERALREGNELAAILMASVRTARARGRRTRGG